MAVLEVQHIEKHFGATQVLEDISFDLEQGQALAIIGSSGSGKTTLLRCLNFLEKPDHGSISVNGSVIFDAADPPPSGRARSARSGSTSAWCSSLQPLPPVHGAEKRHPGKELLSQERPDFKENKKAILEEIQAEGRELLAKMGLSDRAGHYPSQLSGGQQQRTAIGRALITRPKLILADEPTGNLDSRNSQDVIALLTRASRRFQQTILMITHNRSLTASVDRVFQVSDGVLTDLGGNTDEALS